ncbi:hypothetical protein [Micromonospora sp. NPDC047074]
MQALLNRAAAAQVVVDRRPLSVWRHQPFTAARSTLLTSNKSFGA